MLLSVKFWIGIILLVINQPLGWSVMLICNAGAVKNQSAILSFLGIGAYILSWGMLLLGLLLAGPEGIKYSRNLFKKLRFFLTNLFA
jgi:hypothetical protein